LSVLVVTHDVALAQRTDRIVRIADGRIATHGWRGQEELVAVDQRGMVQFSRDMLIEAGIGDNVRVKLTDDGILLQPEDRLE